MGGCGVDTHCKQHICSVCSTIIQYIAVVVFSLPARPGNEATSFPGSPHLRALLCISIAHDL